MNTIVEYHGTMKEVIEWLHENIEYDSLSGSGRTGFNETNFEVFGVYTSEPWVSFRHERDALLFKLRWS